MQQVLFYKHQIQANNVAELLSEIICANSNTFVSDKEQIVHVKWNKCIEADPSIQ